MNQGLALVDSNVLVYALYADAKQHDASLQLLDRAQDGQVSLCMAPQNFLEFFAVITDSRRVGAPYTAVAALEAIEKIQEMPGMTVLPVPLDVVTRVTELVRDHPVTRGAVFDANLVATMLGNDVHRIYTYDRSDFEQFSDLEILTPGAG